VDRARWQDDGVSVKPGNSVPDARRARQRVAAQAYGEYLRQRTPQQVADDHAPIESSNDIALRDAHW
jgi:hypothetical protein